MKANRAIFPLRAMCRVLGLSTSGYSDWLRRGPSARERRDAELRRGTRRIWRESERIYGCPRIHVALRDEGERINRKRVAQLMREMGIEGVIPRRFKDSTTKREAGGKPAPDLVPRDFSADGPNHLWVVHITYVPTLAGWLYFPVVAGVWSHRDVGWSMARQMPTLPVRDALTMAVRRRQRKHAQVHHSDRSHSALGYISPAALERLHRAA